MTLFAANDGGVYKQHTDATATFQRQLGPGQAGGTRGANAGLNTLQPYDASMAKDGTVYMGLQDNGEAKIEPDGAMYTIYGGDGFFSAVDPDNSRSPTRSTRPATSRSPRTAARRGRTSRRR